MEKNTDFDSLPRRELQALCKKHKIPANMTNVAMAEALKDLYAAESSEENHQTQEPEESSMKVDPPASKSGRRATRSSKKASVAKEDVPEKEIDGIPLIELPDTPVQPSGRKTRSRGMAKTPANGKEVRKEKIDLLRREDTAIPSRREAAKSRSRKVVSFAVGEEEGEGGDQGLVKDVRKQTPMAKHAQLEDEKEKSKSATTRRSARVRGGRGSKAVEKMADFSAVEELDGGKKIVVTEEKKRAVTEPELSDSVVTDEINGREEESSVPVVLEEKEEDKQSDSVVTSQTDVREEEKNSKNTEEQECIAMEAEPSDSLLREADGGDETEVHPGGTLLEVTENGLRKEDDYCSLTVGDNNLEDQGGEEDRNGRGGEATFDEPQPIAGDITVQGGGVIDEGPINGGVADRNLEEEKGDEEEQNTRGGEEAFDELQPIAGDITVEGGGVIDEAPINGGDGNGNLEEEKGDEEDQNAGGVEAAFGVLQPIAGDITVEGGGVIDEAPINGAFDELQPIAGDVTVEGAGGVDEAPTNDGASNRNLEEEKGNEEDQNARGGEAALALLQPIAGDITVEDGGVIDEAPINRNLEEEKVEDEEVTPVQTMKKCNGGSVIDEAPINVAGNRNLEEEKREDEEVTTAQPLQHSNGGGVVDAGNRNLEEEEREVTTAEPTQNSSGGDGSAGELKCEATPDVDDVENVVAVETLHAIREEEPIPLVKPTSVPTVESNSPTPMEMQSTMEGAPPSPVAAQNNEEKGPLPDGVVVCDAGSFSPKMVEEDDPSSPDLLGPLFRSPDGAQVTEEKGEEELLCALPSSSSPLKVNDDVTKEDGEEDLLGELFSSSFSSASPKGAEEGKMEGKGEEEEEEEEEESSDDAAIECNDEKQICKPPSEMTSSTDDDECNCGESNVGGGEFGVCVLPQMIEEEEKDEEEEEEEEEEDPSSPDLLGALFSSPPKVVDEVAKDQEEEEVEEEEEDPSSPLLPGALFSSPKVVDEVVKDKEEEEEEEEDPSPLLPGALFSSSSPNGAESTQVTTEEKEQEENLLGALISSDDPVAEEKAPSLSEMPSSLDDESNCHVHEEGEKTTDVIGAVAELVIEQAAKVGTTAATTIAASSKSGVVESSPSSRKRSVAKKKNPGNDDKENAGAGMMVLNNVVKMNTEVVGKMNTEVQQQQQQLERTTGKNKQERLTVEEMNAMSLRQLRKQLQALNLADETPSRKKDEKKRRFALATLDDNSLKTPQLNKH